MEHFYKQIGNSNEDWFTFSNLYKKVVEDAKDGYKFVEVGSWKGRSSAYLAVEILNSNKNIKFDCVDTWLGSLEHITPTSEWYTSELLQDKDWLYNIFLDNISPISNIINPIRMSSLDACKLYDDNSLDFVFIDASHEYDDVKNDILNWLPKVKNGGILAGHDYGVFFGVTTAVNEIFNIKDLEIYDYCYVYKKTSNELIYYNIDEQRKWNNEGMWIDGGHEWSKSFGDTDNLWNTYIFNTIKPFRNKKVLEIAPGFGRMTQYLSILASQLIVMDLNPLCIKKTKEKMGNHVLAYFVNDGKSLTPIRNNSQDLIFSWDSFVHMHSNVILEYIKEINRVLVPGGCAFIHHSILYGGQDNSLENVAGRSNMNADVFKEMVESNGMKIIDQQLVKFSTVTDCISFFIKK